MFFVCLWHVDTNTQYFYYICLTEKHDDMSWCIDDNCNDYFGSGCWLDEQRHALPWQFKVPVKFIAGISTKQ